MSHTPPVVSALAELSLMPRERLPYVFLEGSTNDRIKESVK
jgi:hypothetical protein